MYSPIQSAKILKVAVFTGAINALINGIINWFQVKGKPELFLTVDSITTHEQTVLGGAVILATSLAIILTTIGYLTFKSPGKPPFYPKALLLILKNGVFTFGILTIFSLLLQRYVGSVAVTPLMSALIVALIAGLVAGTIDYMTKNEILKNNLNR